MQLSDLQAMGAYVPNKLVKKIVPIRRPKPIPESEWADKNTPEFSDEWMDDKLAVHIRIGSAADRIEILRAPGRDQPFIAILRAVCDAQGKPLFESLEQVMGEIDPETGESVPNTGLADWLVFPLFNAITEVAKDRPKALRPRTNGGAKSHSPSEDEASANGSEPSTKTNGPSGKPTEQSAAL